MEEKDKIIFKLSKIITDEFALFEENLNIKGKEVILDGEFSFSIPEKGNEFMVSIKYIFLMKNKPIIVIKASSIFYIEKTIWKDLIHDNKISFPKKAVSQMATLTIGTVRGILHAKTEGTPFNKYFIPQANIYNLIATDIVYELKS